MKAATHPQEADRLAALKAYDILDTVEEREFDDLVKIAAAICQTEASTITFIDIDRQWFKAKVGMPGAPAPIEFAVCAHTVVAGGFLEIEDTLNDPRTLDNPGCHGPRGFRFYAGAQLIGERGLPIGTLCVLGRTPKKLTEIQRAALQILGDQVVKLLELRVALRTAAVLRSEVNHRVKNSLQLVSSLVGLQRRATQNEEVRDALSQTIERVMAIASLHDIMQQTESGTKVNLRKLVDDLCRLLRKILPPQITIETDIIDVDVSSNTGSSVAVIVNEFASNSIKHGFSNGQSGSIKFTCRVTETAGLELSCSDDGAGTGAFGITRVQSAGGLGMIAMQACADQIDGHLVVGKPSKGYQISLFFET